MQSRLMKLAGVAAALAMSVSSTMAAAAPVSPVRTVSPLVAVSLFGTQASAQTVCSQGASAAATAGAAAAAQGATGCVLPAGEPAPPPVAQGVPPPPPGATNYGINWILAGLGALALIGGLITLFHDDDDEDNIVSPV